MWYPIRLSERHFIGLYGRLNYHILWFYWIKYTICCVIEESDQQRQKVTHVDCNDIQQNNPQIFSYQVPYLFQCSPLPCSYYFLSRKQYIHESERTKYPEFQLNRL